MGALYRVKTVLVATLALCAVAHADDGKGVDSYLRDQVVLTLHEPAHADITFTLDQLEKLPHRRIKAYFADLHDGTNPSLWEGVPLSALTSRMGDGNGITVEALNNYSHFIPMKDMKAYEPILAYKRDGHYMSVRHFGPLIVIYPIDDRPELRNNLTYGKMVWQVNGIKLEAGG